MDISFRTGGVIIINFKDTKLINRFLAYILGLFFLSLGVTFSINSQLGISPVNSLPYVISLITGQEMGIVLIALGISIYMNTKLINMPMEALT